MKSAKMILPNSLLVLALALYGCTTTLKPVKVAPSIASFDGTNLNSGVISYNVTNGIGVVTADWRDRYNVLIGDYSKKFTPSLIADHGLVALPDTTWYATAEALVAMGKMELWRRNNIK